MSYAPSFFVYEFPFSPMEFFVNRSFLLAVTGGIGCGKSWVMGQLRCHSFVTLSCDEVAHALLDDVELVDQLVEQFGDTILMESKKINRKALAERVFNDERARLALNGLVHPLVGEQVVNWMEARRGLKERGAVEVPLLFECGWDAWEWDAIVAVKADEVIVRERLHERGWSAAEMEQRLEAQWPVERKAERADFILNTSEPEIEVEKKLRAQVMRWLQKGM